jgi:hypothetical protein
VEKESRHCLQASGGSGCQHGRCKVGGRKIVYVARHEMLSRVHQRLTQTTNPSLLFHVWPGCCKVLPQSVHKDHHRCQFKHETEFVASN